MAQPVGSRFQGERPCHPKTSRRCYDSAVGTRLVRQLRDQPALADAGIARDDEQSRPAFASAFPALEDLV